MSALLNEKSPEPTIISSSDLPASAETSTNMLCAYVVSVAQHQAVLVTSVEPLR